jgi:hypothetical protein
MPKSPITAKRTVADATLGSSDRVPFTTASAGSQLDASNTNEAIVAARIAVFIWSLKTVRINHTQKKAIGISPLLSELMGSSRLPMRILTREDEKASEQSPEAGLAIYGSDQRAG